MTFYTHINRHRIRAGEPAITIKKGKRGKPTYCTEVELPPGSRLMSSLLEPILPCGAKVVIVSSSEPRVVA